MKKSVHVFCSIMLENYGKISSEWGDTYHFDNEKEEFINDDIMHDIISIFDLIEIEAKKDLFNYFLILPSSDQLERRTVALSFLSESLNELDDDKKIVSVP